MARWARIAGGLAGVAVVGVLLVVLPGLLDVRSVHVAGAQRIPAAVVREAVGPVLGRSMVRLDAATLRRRVLAQVPGEASVSVERRFPHGLRIVVREQAAAAVVAGPAGGVDVAVGGSGASLGAARPADAALPRLAGTPADAAGATGRAALAVLASLPAELRAQVSGLAAATPAAVTLTLRDGTVVGWGGPTDGERKVQVLTALRTLGRKGPFDVSSPTVAISR
jgi:cell division protein FtsQ